MVAILNLVGKFNYDRLMGISSMSFFGSHSELKFSTSDFRLQISEVPTELLQF